MDHVLGGKVLMHDAKVVLLDFTFLIEPADEMTDNNQHALKLEQTTQRNMLNALTDNGLVQHWLNEDAFDAANERRRE